MYKNSPEIGGSYRNYPTAEFGVKNYDEAQLLRKIHVHSHHGFTVWEIISAVVLGLALFCIVNGVTHLLLLCLISVYTVLVGICCLWGRHLSTVLHFLLSLIFLFVLCLVCCINVSHGYSGNLSKGLPCTDSPINGAPLRRLQEHVELVDKFPSTQQSLTSTPPQISFEGTHCETPRLAALILGEAIFSSIGILVLGFLLFHGWNGTQVPFLYHRQLQSHWKRLEFEGRFRFSFWQLFVGILGSLCILTIVHLALLDFLVGIPLLLLLSVGTISWIVLKQDSVIRYHPDYKLEKEAPSVVYHENNSGCHKFSCDTKIIHNEQPRKVVATILVIVALASVICTSIRLSSLENGNSVYYPTGLGLESPVAEAIEQRREQKDLSQILLGTEIPIIVTPNDIDLVSHRRRLSPTNSDSEELSSVVSHDAAVSAGLLSIGSEVISVLVLIFALFILGVEIMGKSFFFYDFSTDDIWYSPTKQDILPTWALYELDDKAPSEDNINRNMSNRNQFKPPTMEDVKYRFDDKENVSVSNVIENEVPPSVVISPNQILSQLSSSEASDVIQAVHKRTDTSSSSEASTRMEWCTWEGRFIFYKLYLIT